MSNIETYIQNFDSFENNLIYDFTFVKRNGDYKNFMIMYIVWKII